MRRLTYFSPLFLTLILGGCDLLSDATTFSVDTDWKNITVDSAELGLVVPSGAQIPAISCNGSDDLCAQAGAQLSCGSGSYSCDIACGSGGTCEVGLGAVLSLEIDELGDRIGSKTEASALSKATLDRMVYNIDENTLNFGTPQLDLYIGPQGSTSITDPGVVIFGTLPTIPAGSVEPGLVATTEAGKDALAAFVKNYQTPFVLLADVSMSFASGQPIPQGRLAMKIKAYFEITPL